MTDEADRTYTNLLKTELFGSNLIDRPSPTHTSSAPNLPLRHAGSSQSASLYQANSTGDGFLGPLPAHSPSTPRTSAVGAFASGGGPRSSRSTPAYSEAPVTPTKRRVLDFSSPTSAMRSSPTSRSGGVKASPGNIGLGHKSATGVSMGLDDMMHEKYSLTPMGRESQKLLVGTKKPTRWISKTPFKVLDAPELAVSNSHRDSYSDQC
jgi:cell division cycle 20-like protein 1 (cofactor of APC complex)